MAGMRDRLIHDYFGVDFELVWDVVETISQPCAVRSRQFLRRSKGLHAWSAAERLSSIPGRTVLYSEVNQVGEFAADAEKSVDRISPISRHMGA